MEGHAHVRTFPHIAMDPETKPLYDLMHNNNGEPRTAEGVWISYLGANRAFKPILREGKLTAEYGAPVQGPKIGPEYTFGLTLEQRIPNPILLIKTAWGGQSLYQNFRPPSAGPYKLNEYEIEQVSKNGKSIAEVETRINEKAGERYRQMIDHVEDVLANIQRVYPDYDPKQGYQIAGFIWFQGWNDKVARSVYPNRDKPGGYDLYSELLAHFIRDVRRDLKAPDMPLVIGVMGVGGEIDINNPPNQHAHKNYYFRQAMAAPASWPEFENNVIAVYTEKYWDDELGTIDTKWEQLKAKKNRLRKNKDLNPDEQKAQSEAYMNEIFTPEELELRELAISNFGFHYMGSAKIFAQIGHGFADALQPQDKHE